MIPSDKVQNLAKLGMGSGAWEEVFGMVSGSGADMFLLFQMVSA